MEYITLFDYFLTPFYLLFIYIGAYFIKKWNYSFGHPWRHYFIPALTCKILGAVFIGMLYQYYYGMGDTFYYYDHATTINSAFVESPGKWFNLVFRIPDWYEGGYSKYISKMIWYEAPSEYTVAAITAVVGMLTLTTYLPIAVIFATVAFTGIWALFRTFATLYPAYTKYIAWVTLFVPSTIMWGSGIFKDTICMFALGWLTYGAFRMLISRDFSLRNILLTVVSFYLIASIKVYILMAFLPAVVLWILFTYSKRISVLLIRVIVNVAVVGMCIGGFLFFAQKFSAELGKYSLEKVVTTSYVTSSFIASQSGDEGSAYSLGELDPTVGGMLKKFPAAVNVTLFRPYIWETRKVIQLLNAIEAFLFMWVTVKLFLKVGTRKIWKTLSTDPNIQFCLIFTIIFAFAIGLSSGNFGTLSRYRIPCLPFFGLTLVLLYYKNVDTDNNILGLK
jgi:hypothetical protein